MHVKRVCALHNLQLQYFIHALNCTCLQNKCLNIGVKHKHVTGVPVPLQTYKMASGATGAKCEADNGTRSKLLIAGIVLAGVVLFALLFAAVIFWR